MRECDDGYPSCRMAEAGGDWCKDECLALNYHNIRTLPTGEIAGLMNLIFTTGLFVGLERDRYRTRYCYKNCDEASKALADWDGIGDPPGPWIKQKPENRLNPNLPSVDHLVDKK